MRLVTDEDIEEGYAPKRWVVVRSDRVRCAHWMKGPSRFFKHKRRRMAGK